jgi:hypothetical protein
MSKTAFPQVGDEVLISFTGKVSAIFTSTFGIDIITVDSGEGEDKCRNTFWPANQNVAINIIEKAQP